MLVAVVAGHYHNIAMWHAIQPINSFLDILLPAGVRHIAGVYEEVAWRNRRILAMGVGYADYTDRWLSARWREGCASELR